MFENLLLVNILKTAKSSPQIVHRFIGGAGMEVEPSNRRIVLD